jgi:hypothetical protein
MSSVINDTLLAIKSAFEAGVNIFNGGTAVSSSNPLPVAQTDGLAVSGTATEATVLFTTSMLNYESITVQVTSAGTNCTVTYETSDDNVSWIACSGLSFTNVGNSALAITSSAVGGIQFTRKGLYFRARVSAYGSGTVTAIGTLSKAPAVQQGLIYIGGGLSFEGGGANTNPIAIAAEARTSSKTGVANATLVRPIATIDGRLITRLNSIPQNEWQYAAESGGITDTANVELVAAQGAGIKNYLTGLSVGNANATASEIVIKDGATVIWRMYLAANAPIQSINFVTPLQSTANTKLNVACIMPGTRTYINAQGYKAP